jgi:hypothetical protein
MWIAGFRQPQDRVALALAGSAQGAQATEKAPLNSRTRPWRQVPARSRHLQNGSEGGDRRERRLGRWRGKKRSFYVKLDEARFYFPPDIRAQLETIHATCERFFAHLAKRNRLNIDNREEWSQLADALTADQVELREIYASLPKSFEPALAFRQLTVGG